jgi:hypothetical protein
VTPAQSVKQDYVKAHGAPQRLGKGKPVSFLSLMNTVKYWVILTLVMVANASFSGEESRNPFESVKVKGEKIEVIVSASGPRWVAITDQNATSANHPKTFLLADGEQLQLVDKHEHYWFIASVSARKKGLQTRYRFDSRSFGGELIEKSYFIKAE